MVEKAEELFKMADVNGDGHLTIEEFTALMEQAKQKYPQVQVLFSKAEHSMIKWENLDTLFTHRFIRLRNRDWKRDHVRVHSML